MVFFAPIGLQNEILYLFFSIGFSYPGTMPGMPIPPLAEIGLKIFIPLELNLLNTKSVPVEPIPFLI